VATTDSHIEPNVAPIPPGWFVMGSDEGRDDEQPVHRVWIDDLALAVVPVTNAEYVRFVDATAHSAPPMWNDSKFSHPDQPVVSVTWVDAAAYCDWLSALSGRSYRLPTEAEREKAARGGLEDNAYPWGDELPDWMDATGRGAKFETPERVGQDPSNGYGLHNMGDLVHEWCSDWYQPDYYQASPDRNPPGPQEGARKVSRGGAWRHRVKVARCAARSAIPPDRMYTDYGFRVALVP
jgi:sulfatase modifying factor 1